MNLLMDPRAWLAVLGLSVVGIAISLGAYWAGREVGGSCAILADQ